MEYALKLRNQDFDNPMRESQGTVDRFAASIPPAVRQLAEFTFVAGGAAAGAAAFGIATKLALSNLEAYADFDGLVRGLKTLEGTADATTKRIERLREVAKSPGLGFEEAVKGDIRLRSAGLSADLAARALGAFGNAIASVGGGKADLDGAVLALSQMAALGKVTAEDMNQLGGRMPQIRAAMKAAFGTADTEALQALGLSIEEIMEGLVGQLEKLPQATGGARNALDNYTMGWSELKVEAAEFGTWLSSTWVNDAAGAFSYAAKKLREFKKDLGMETPGLAGKDSQTEEERAAERAADATAAAAQRAANDEIRAHNESVLFRERNHQEYLEGIRLADAKAAQQRVEAEKKAASAISAAQEKVYAARLTREADLSRQIEALRTAGPTGAAAINSEKDVVARAEIATRTAELVSLERELKDIREGEAERQTALAKAASEKAAAAGRELAAHAQSRTFFELENQLLDARGTRQNKLAETLERQLKTEQLKLQLMRDQGLAEEDAMEAAKRRISLEERAAKPRRRGLLDRAAAETGGGNTEKLAREDLARRRGRMLTPDAAAELLARRGRGADPGKLARDEKAEAARKAADPMYRVVKAIEEKLNTLATA